jgi:hypothetical protein
VYKFSPQPYLEISDTLVCEQLTFVFVSKTSDWKYLSPSVDVTTEPYDAIRACINFTEKLKFHSHLIRLLLKYRAKLPVNILI